MIALGERIKPHLAASPWSAIVHTRGKALGPNAQGGGIFLLGVATVALTATTVTANVPDNCSPAGSIAGCVG